MVGAHLLSFNIWFTSILLFLISLLYHRLLLIDLNLCYISGFSVAVQYNGLESFQVCSYQGIKDSESPPTNVLPLPYDPLLDAIPLYTATSNGVHQCVHPPPRHGAVDDLQLHPHVSLHDLGHTRPEMILAFNIPVVKLRSSKSTAPTVIPLRSTAFGSSWASVTLWS